MATILYRGFGAGKEHLAGSTTVEMFLQFLA
jgi:hypothetical protein